MTVTILPITDHDQYSVNGHQVYKSDDKWISRTPLSETELKAFKRYEKLVINNTAFKKHTKATYKQ